MVAPGTPNGKPYHFKGEADQAKGKKNGDIVFMIEEKKHNVFKRQGADLLYTKEISIQESLNGVNFNLKTLGGQIVKVTSKEDEVIAHD